MNHRIPVLLDGDPGHDDAIAWMLAATGLDIRGVSSVAGNQTIEKTTRNALRICTLLGIKAPVAMGLARPLLSEALTAPSVHGVSGLDGPALPEPDREAAPESAPEQMARLLRENAEPLTIVATAPLTNVAALLLAHPELKANIAGISLMAAALPTETGRLQPNSTFSRTPRRRTSCSAPACPSPWPGWMSRSRPCSTLRTLRASAPSATPWRRPSRAGWTSSLPSTAQRLRRSARARRRGRVRPAAA